MVFEVISETSDGIDDTQVNSIVLLKQKHYLTDYQQTA